MKLCKDCLYFGSGEGPYFPWTYPCGHPRATQVDPVTGDKTQKSCVKMRGEVPGEVGLCGNLGFLWEEWHP